MTIGRMYLALLVASVVAGFVLRLLDAGVAGFNSARDIGHTLGQSATVFLAAALVPTVSILLTRKWKESAASPTIVGMLVLVAFSYLIYHGTEVSRTLAFFTFEPPGCTFSASFPDTPEVKEVVVPGGFVVTQANFYGRDMALQAECGLTEAWFALTKEAVMAELREYALRTGLTYAEFEVSESDGFLRGWARGRKTVSGQPATYEVYLLADSASMMALIAGGVSSGYPQRGTHEFLTSGRHLATGTQQTIHSSDGAR